MDLVFTSFSRCYPPQPNGECWAGHEMKWKFSLYNDTRTCSPCSCGEPSRGDCRVETTFYRQAGCSEALGSVLISGLDQELCTDTIEGRIAAVRSIFNKDEPTCAPSTDSTVVSGEIVPGDTHVLCCNR
ncbi:hypothetical protein [Sorangium cellulosum]|uniref:hypothetical protein n=1 Tax=Sorangium cellulosum TaxID=56 RepID=UPI001012DA7D|nr:hypothetical protein [Sorangium cellulosum]